MPETRPAGGEAGDKRSSAWLWVGAIALSGAASTWTVRLASPAALDEKLTTLVLFFIVPGLLILLLAAMRRRLGIILAALFPFAWLLISKDPSDSLLLWLVPIAAMILVVPAGGGRGGRRPPNRAMWAPVLLAGAALLWPGPNRPATGTRVLLIGLDGATWDVIDPLVAAGGMPNLASILDNGHTARLRSLPGMFSPQVWSTIGTGCDPGGHGILGFGQRKSDFRVGTLWDRMKLDGRSFGLCGWYFTWPPEPGMEHSDFIIPSNIAPDAATYPPEYSFYRDLIEWTGQGERKGRHTGVRSHAVAGLRAWRHGIRLSTLRRGIQEFLGRRLARRRDLLDEIWKNRELSAALQADLFAHLVRTRHTEFAAVLFTQIDHVCHRYWKYMEPEGFPEVTPGHRSRYGHVINTVYAEIDRGLGKILRSAPADAEVVVVSDHGFQAAYQKVAGKFCRIRTTKLIEALGLTGSLVGTNLDFDVFLQAAGSSPADSKDVLAQVEGTLRGAHIAGEDSPLFGMENRQDLIRLWIAPRLLVREDSRIVMGGNEYPFGELIRARREAHYSGQHHPDGIYLLAGPSAGKASGADSLNVLDIAPTVAALLGLPVNPMWQGRPALKGLPSDRIAVAAYPPPGTPDGRPPQMDEELKRKLRAMGYLD